MYICMQACLYVCTFTYHKYSSTYVMVGIDKENYSLHKNAPKTTFKYIMFTLKTSHNSIGKIIQVLTLEAKL